MAGVELARRTDAVTTQLPVKCLRPPAGALGAWTELVQTATAAGSPWKSFQDWYNSPRS